MSTKNDPVYRRDLGRNLEFARAYGAGPKFTSGMIDEILKAARDAYESGSTKSILYPQAYWEVKNVLSNNGFIVED